MIASKIWKYTECRRGAEPNVVEAWTPVVRVNTGDPAPLEQHDIAIRTAMSDESTSVIRGAVSEVDDESGLASGASLKASEARSTI